SFQAPHVSSQGAALTRATARTSSVVPSYPAGFLDALVGVADFLALGLGNLDHLVGQALGEQLVRVVLAHELAVGPLDVVVTGLGGHAQDGVGIVDAHAAAAGGAAGALAPA